MKLFLVFLSVSFSMSCKAQDFSVKELLLLVGKDYNNFETVVTSKGFEYYKTGTSRIENEVIKNHAFMKVNRDDTSNMMTYIIQSLESPRLITRVSVGLTVREARIFSILKSQIQLNGYVVRRTYDASGGSSIVTEYLHPTKNESLETTVTHNIELGIRTYDVSVTRRK
jgi:hypothetical protein